MKREKKKEKIFNNIFLINKLYKCGKRKRNVEYEYDIEQFGDASKGVYWGRDKTKENIELLKRVSVPQSSNEGRNADTRVISVIKGSLVVYRVEDFAKDISGRRLIGERILTEEDLEVLKSE